MTLKQDIQKLYRENPNVSSKEIIKRLNIQPTRQFWRTLESVQVGIRGSRRVEGSKGKRVRFRKLHKGVVYFIPPEEK